MEHRATGAVEPIRAPCAPNPAGLSCRGGAAATPLHLPQLIGPMQHYLWILKTTHSGADMDVALEMAKGSLDADLQWNLHDLLSHRQDWWVPGKLVELRLRLQGYREVGLLSHMPRRACLPCHAQAGPVAELGMCLELQVSMTV